MPINKRLTILGSGPAGLTAAIYAARADLSPLLIDGSQPGGQLTITTEVDNFPGFADGIMGPELMDAMRKQAERVGTTFLADIAESIDLSVRPFKIKTGSDEIHTESLIICTGATARFLGLDAEKKLMGRGVSGCATCDGPLPFFRGKHLFVIGGGDAAMQEAGFLTRFAASVTIVHRRDTFRASKIMVQAAKSNPKIKFVLDSAVVDILANATGSVGSIKVRNLKTQAEQVLPADGVFIAIGHEPNTKLFQGQLELNPQGYIITTGVSTSVPGVFAAGDVQDFRYKQAVTAAGTGCEAALEAQWYLEKLDAEKAESTKS